MVYNFNRLSNPLLLLAFLSTEYLEYISFFVLHCRHNHHHHHCRRRRWSAVASFFLIINTHNVLFRSIAAGSYIRVRNWNLVPALGYYYRIRFRPPTTTALHIAIANCLFCLLMSRCVQLNSAGKPIREESDAARAVTQRRRRNPKLFALYT